MKQSVLTDIRAQADEGHLAEDLVIEYRIQGGSHDETVDEAIALNANGAVRVVVSDKLGRKPAGDVIADLGREAVVDLGRLIERGIEGLIPRSEARFLPDSLVGSIQVGFGDRTETFYFYADEDQREQAAAPQLSADTVALLTRFEEIQSTCLAQGEDDL
jgi:hypothetical protein